MTPIFAAALMPPAPPCAARGGRARIGTGEPYQAELLLGIIASARGEFDEAIARFARARDLNPYQTGAFVLLAATHEVMGRADDARRDVAAGLAVDARNERLLEIDRRLRATR